MFLLASPVGLTQHLVQCVPKLKGPEREADHKSSLTAEDSVYGLFYDVRCSHGVHCEGYCIL
jgi:hypothetical protein